MWGVRRAVVPLAAILAVTTGCFASKETREGAERLEEALGNPSWARSVAVDTRVSGVSDDVVETLVVLEDEAQPDQIADFVLDHPAKVDDAGLGPGFADLRFETGDGAVLIVPSGEPTDEDAVRAAVERWRAVLPLLGSTSTAELARTTGGSAYVASLPVGGAQAVVGLFGELRADRSLSAPTDGWSVATTVGDTTMSLSSYTLPTAAEVRTWTELVEALEPLPAGFKPTQVSMERIEGRTIVDQTLVLPAEVTRDNITPAAYGDQLWPALSGQLRAVHEIEGRWTYVVEWASADLPESTTTLISLLDDQQPIDNGDPASLWSRKARDYVDGL